MLSQCLRFPLVGHPFMGCLIIAAIGFSPASAEATIVDQVERPPDNAIEYRLERVADIGPDLKARFTPTQLALLEKLNRVDLAHMRRLEHVVVPSAWKDELEHSPFPKTYPAATHLPKLLVVDQPAQAFAAYESGQLTRWGPTSSGRQAKPTPSGLFHLNWRARVRNSTLNGQWRLNWYFNFLNARGLAFHQFELPGLPASHACVRLLERDAMWIYQWGYSWTLDARSQLLQNGTPVLIVGSYAFGAPPPWRSVDQLARPIVLPAVW
jgi:hypothetical protein